MRRVTLGLALLALFVLAPPASAWTWPLHGDVLRPYSLGPDPTRPGSTAASMSAGAAGEPVRAPASGTVSFAGVVPGSGRTVTIQLDGYAVSLTHLGEITVAKGAVVTEGDPVGLAGASGDAEWPTPYVHLGIRVSAAADGYRRSGHAPATAALCCRPRRRRRPSPGARTVAGRGRHATPIVTPPPAATPTPGAGSPSTTPAPAAPSVPAPATPAPAAGGVPLPESAGTGPAPAGAARGTPVPAPASTTWPARPCGWARWRRRRASLRRSMGQRSMGQRSWVNGEWVSGRAARIRRGSGRYRPVAPTGGGPGDRRRSRSRAPPRLVEGTRAAPRL